MQPVCSTIWRHGCWNDYSITNASYQTASYIEEPVISPACFADVCCILLMCQWPDVSGPCSVRGTDKTKSSAREKCCLMSCSFKPLSTDRAFYPVSVLKGSREKERQRVVLAERKRHDSSFVVVVFSPRFFCMGRITSTTSVRHHLRFMALWGFSWMRWRASEMRGCTCFFSLFLLTL